MTKNLFITAIGGDIACATLRCIINKYEYTKIIGCDISKYVQGAMYIDEFELAPRYDSVNDYVDFIKRICIERKVTHFLPMTEAEIGIANDNRVFFVNHGIKLMINNELMIDVAKSKYKTAKFLNQNNILSPETFYKENFKDQLSFPLIVKPDQSCGSKNIFVVNNKLEYEYACLSSKDSVVQRYIGNSDEEYTVGIFSNGVVAKSIAFKRKLGFGGMSIFVETIDDPVIHSISQKVASIFNLKGSINIQLRKENGNYYIFEINPRISSTVGFRHKMGFHDVIWWLDMLDGIEQNIEFNIIGGKKGIRILDELILKDVY